MSVPLLSLALVLGCAIGFAGADLLRKALSHRIRPVPLLFVLAAGMIPAFIGWWIWQTQTRQCRRRAIGFRDWDLCCSTWLPI